MEPISTIAVIGVGGMVIGAVAIFSSTKVERDYNEPEYENCKVDPDTYDEVWEKYGEGK